MLLFEDVVEYFKSFQGESPFTGVRTLFIRFKHCNLQNICHFCDTLEIMKRSPFNVLFYDVAKNLQHSNLQILTFTGGEPTLPKYREQIRKFLDYLRTKFPLLLTTKKFLIETNGCGLLETIELLDQHLDHTWFIWSPKFFNDSLFNQAMQTLVGLQRFEDRPNICLKPVIDIHDQEYVKRFETFMSSVDDDLRQNTYIMVKGSTTEELKKNSLETIKYAEKFQTHISPRIHISYNLP